ncbi:unnamed protein product [Orchesella dallaii]|uniref:Beta-ketoacyl synthase-like N-terminal domain-containing protein n=1 Tax=Orchesella dallaii TaxID=48710 RepID=A0ABP1Q8A1_9HEXA
MYKKLTCAFCLVISIFIIAVVIYLLLTETNLFSEKPPEIKAPKISIYFINGTTGTERLLHKKANSDFVLDFKSLNLSTVQYSGGGGGEIDYYQQPTRRNLLRIQCHSNYPVQLKYVGIGNIANARNHNRRQVEEFSDRSTYSYMTALEFITVHEGITGKYVCQIRDENVLMASTFVYVFAAGSQSFVSHSARQLVAKPGAFIEVPCPISYPNKSVTLLSVMQPIQRTVEKEVELDRIVEYDPKRGFILYPNNWGSFICRDEKTSELSGNVTVFMPLEKVVKGRILKISSQNVSNQNRSLRLECRATEPIELKFINFIKIAKDVKEVKSKEYPYGKRIKLDISWFRGNTSIVECITMKDRRVVKTWKFLNHELPEEGYDLSDVQLYLKRSGKEKGYQCCAEGRVVTRPVLTTYPCNTPTECELRTPCLSHSMLRDSETARNCPAFNLANDAIYEGDQGCSLLKIENERSGIIRCSMDLLTKEYTYFTGKDMDGTYSSTLLPKKKVDPQAILKISQKPGPKRTSNMKGSTARFDCEGSKMHFAREFQWGVEKINEPIKYLVNKASPNNEAWVTAALDDHDVIKALVLAQSLRKLGTDKRLALITGPNLSDKNKAALKKVFDITFPIEQNFSNLNGFKSEDYAKIFAFSLQFFDNCVYLTPSSLVLKNCDEIFENTFVDLCIGVDGNDHPDTSVFLYKPQLCTYENLLDKAKAHAGKETFGKFLKKWMTNQGKNVECLDKKYHQKLSLQGGAFLAENESNLSIVNFVDVGPNEIKQSIDDHSFNPRDLGILESYVVNQWWKVYLEDVQDVLTESKTLENANSEHWEWPQKRASHVKEPIAIVGMSCRYPDADNVNEFWQLLNEGREGIREVPLHRWTRESVGRRLPEQMRKTRAGFLKTPVDVRF